MGVKQSVQQKQKFHFLDGKDIQQTGFVPVSHKTSLQPIRQRTRSSFQGPGQGQEGQYTGLLQFQVPEKYRTKMEQNPLKQQIPSLKQNNVFDPYLFKKSLNVYYGQWQNGKPHGYGKIYNPDIDFYYQGYLQQGLPSYYGVFLTDTVQYRGQIKFGRAEGKGRYIERNKVIQGEFTQNQPYKNCIQKSHNYLFNGDYENGKWKKGKLSWKNNLFIYEGEFKDGKMHGSGSLKTEQYFYQGQFQKGKKQGFGSFLWNSGQNYKGQFSQDELTGQGQLYIYDKIVYKGQFKKGKAHGKGYAFENQRLIHSIWSNGQIQEIC